MWNCCALRGFVAAVTALFLSTGHDRAAAAQNTPTLSVSTLLTDLADPWDLAFLPSGEVLYTEQCKGLSILKADNSTVFLFGVDANDDAPSLVAPDVFCEGQSGVLGITVDPSFSSNRFIYAFVASMLGVRHTTPFSPCTLPQSL